MIIVIKLTKFINYAKYLLKLLETARPKKGAKQPLMEPVKPMIYFL
jgi:hypothetical protein